MKNKVSLLSLSIRLPKGPGCNVGISRRQASSHWRIFEDGTIEEVLRRFPLSAEWQRSLLRRMEAVATCYRIARDAAGPYEGRMWWRWERSGPLDAVMTLPDGCSLGIARFGSALPRRGMFSRLGSLLEMYRRNLLFGVLVVAPGPIEVHSIPRMDAGKKFQHVRLC